MENDFYKDKYFCELTERMDRIETKLGLLENKLDSINNKVTYIYGWAAGAGVLAAIVANYLIK